MCYVKGTCGVFWDRFDAPVSQEILELSLKVFVVVV